jgi:hypothetical protein
LKVLEDDDDEKPAAPPPVEKKRIPLTTVSGPASGKSEAGGSPSVGKVGRRVNLITLSSSPSSKKN